MKKTILTSAISIISLIAFTTGTFAQETDFRINQIYQVNKFSESYQINPVVVRQNKQKIIVWESFGQDSSGYGIFARIYDPEGESQGEFRVNSMVDGHQRNPYLAIKDSGEFIITWESQAPDQKSSNIYARLFDKTGKPVGQEFLVNEENQGFNSKPRISLNTQGTFVITWQREDIQKLESDIYARIFELLPAEISLNIEAEETQKTIIKTSTVPVIREAEFRVNTTAGGSQNSPVVSLNNNGLFVIAWENYNLSGNDSDIHARVFNRKGEVVSNQLVINKTLESYQNQPSVAMSDDGNFLVAWEGFSKNDSTGIVARRFSQTGTELSDEFQVNTFTAFHQSNPFVCLLDNDRYLIGWQSYGEDSSGYGVYIRLFQPEKQGRDFLLNDLYTIGDQRNVNLAYERENNELTATWQSYKQDGDGYGVFAIDLNLKTLKQQEINP